MTDQSKTLSNESFLERILLKLFDHFDIVKKINGVDTLYLRRFYLFKSQRFSIYIHKIARSDDDPDPHDHPWDFTSFILKGGYFDESYIFKSDWFKDGERGGEFDLEAGCGAKTGRLHYRPRTFIHTGNREVWRWRDWVGPFSLVHRKAEHIHRVVLPTNKPAWTLVFIGKERRPWGFISEDRWIYWRTYLNCWGSENHA